MQVPELQAYAQGLVKNLFLKVRQYRVAATVPCEAYGYLKGLKGVPLLSVLFFQDKKGRLFLISKLESTKCDLKGMQCQPETCLEMILCTGVVNTI